MTKAGVGAGTGTGTGTGAGATARAGSRAGATVAAADAPAPAALLPRRRGVELSLIVLAVLLSVYGYCAVGLAKHGTVPPGAAGYGAGLGVLALLAHLTVRLRAPAPTRSCCPSPYCSTGWAWC